MYHYTDIVVDGGSRVGAQIESWAAGGHTWPRDVTTLAPPSTIMSVYTHMVSVRRVLPGLQQFRSQVFPLTHARINRCTGVCTFPCTVHVRTACGDRLVKGLRSKPSIRKFGSMTFTRSLVISRVMRDLLLSRLRCQQLSPLVIEKQLTGDVTQLLLPVDWLFLQLLETYNIATWVPGIHRANPLPERGIHQYM